MVLRHGHFVLRNRGRVGPGGRRVLVLAVLLDLVSLVFGNVFGFVGWTYRWDIRGVIDESQRHGIESLAPGRRVAGPIDAGTVGHRDCGPRGW